MRDDAALFDVDSVRRLEAAALADAGDPDALMERAGQAAWRHALDRWPRARSFVVVCGRGGNGGDGYVFARLANASGCSARVVADHPRAPTHPSAARARERFLEAGGIESAGVDVSGADLVIDALLGIGLRGALSPRAAELVRAVNAQPAPVLALDVPSGLDAAGTFAEAVEADATLEFLLPKAALQGGAARDVRGSLHVADLGVPQALRAAVAPCAFGLDARDLPGRFPPRRRDSHKGSNGRVLCLGGAPGMGGALLLCVEAALRAGAGLVRACTHADHLAPLLVRVPEAMAGVEPPADGWADAVAIGPGLGQGEWGRALWTWVLEQPAPAVADADALNLLAASPRPLPARWVLTPHPGEAARLLGSSVQAVQSDRLRATAELARRFGAVVVLKGAGTVVAAPGRVPALVLAGNPGMATGGMGDVLTGVVAALLARGADAFDAACTGALLHACAGDAAALDGGERGLLPTDLMPFLRRLANP